MDKKSFILYENWAIMLSKMPDEEAGKLIKAICSYELSGECIEDGSSVSAVFSMIKVKLDEDKKKYEETCQKRKEAVKTRWEKQKDSNVIQNDTNEYKCIQMNTDTDNDTDNYNNKDIYISLLLEDGSSYEVTKEELEENKKIYPNVDVEQSYRSMAGWLLSNPSKRKTRKGIKRFINGWLSREKEEKKDHKNKQYDFKKLEEWVKAQ